MSSRGRGLRVDLLLMAVAASWGSTYWVAKELVQAGSVLGMLGVRMAATALVLAACLLLAGRRISRASLGLGLVFGLTLATVFSLETFGIADTTATNAGLIISLTMVMTPVLEARVQGTRMSAPYVAGGLAAVVGVVLLSTNGSLTAPRAGDWLILGAAVVRAVHVTAVKKMSQDRPVDDLGLTLVQMGTCAVLFTLAGVAVGDGPVAYAAALDATDWWRMLYLVGACTVFAFYVQMWAVRRTSASRVSLVLGTEPIYAALVGLLLAGDHLTPVGWLGLVIVLAAVTSVQWLTAAKPEQAGAAPVPAAAAAPAPLPLAVDAPVAPEPVR